MSRDKMSRDDELLRQHRRGEAMMQGLAAHIEETLPEGFAFALVAFTCGEGGYVGYVSNAERGDMIAALRECADTLEARRDSPPGAPIVRQH
jgi:hypothetical protein